MLGGVIVVVGFFVILMIHEGGHLVAAKAFGMKATRYFLGFGPTLWSFRRGETEYGVKAIPAGGFVSIIGMNPLEYVAPEEESRTYRGRPFYQKSVVVMAGVATHFVIAFILIWTANVLIGRPDPDRPQLEIARVVSETADGYPTAAVEAGLKAGDRLLSIDGAPLDNWSDLTEALRASPNRFVQMEVERNGERLTLGGELTSRIDPDTGQETGFLGVSPVIGRTRDNPIAGVGVTVGRIAFFTTQSVRGIWTLVSNFGSFLGAVFTNNDEAIDEARPVSVIGITQFGAASQRIGLNYTLELIAYVSVFVGVLNAVPMYPFDGGHFAVAIYQKVTGRQPDIRKLAPIGALVFFFIVIVGVLGVYFDIVHPLDFG